MLPLTRFGLVNRMNSLLVKSAVAAGIAAGLGLNAFAQKKPLDHSVYDGWKSIRAPQLSRDGKWMAYVIAPQEGDAIGYVKAVGSMKEFKLDRGSTVQFTADSRYAIAVISPKTDEVKKARRDKVAADAMPKATVTVINLSSGERRDLPKASSFELAEEGSTHLLYTIEAPRPTPAAGGSGPRTPGATPPPTPPTPPKPDDFGDDEDQAQRRQRPAGAGAGQGAGRPGGPGAPERPNYTTLVLHDLATGKEEPIEFHGAHVWSKDGASLIYTRASTNQKERALIAYDVSAKKRTTLSQGMSRYAKLTWRDKTKTLAFLGDKDATGKTKDVAIYAWTVGESAPRVIFADGDKAIPAGWTLAESASLSFSDSGRRILTTLTGKSAPEKKDETPEDEKVSVDIWHYKDPFIQTQQLLQAAGDRAKSAQVVLDLCSKSATVLGNDLYSSVSIGAKGDGKWGLATTDMPYRIKSTWDPGYQDTYLVDVTTGKSRKIRENETGFVSLSPSGTKAYGYDSVAREFYSLDLATLKRTSLTKQIPYPIYDELHDTPDAPAPYGVVGWSKGEEKLLVSDAFDIWAVDPNGNSNPQCVTGHYGRTAGIRLRYVPVDPDAETIDLSKPITLTLFDVDSKSAGYGVLDPATRTIKKLIYGEKSYAIASRAKNADVILYTRQDFVEYPDLWASNAAFENGRKVSDANPQQKDYNWGKAELISWTSNDGVKLSGILVKPENFDYSKKYPMITYYYERNSDNLYRYTPPAPSASTVNIPFFASNGYVMFIPDIPYKEGYPGESAMSAIMPGVQAVLARGYVDPKRLGIQGQSWGGYQTAYLVTETNMFAAACSGAAVSDMFSAYGGIRYGSGVLRQMQYEHGQSRIGGTPWEKPLRYLENSPLFFLDKVTTPLLMMHNDKDGAVPWTQGVELYSGMRRLQKPCWMVTYNGEDHNLVERKNRKDWTVRLSQFFDHFLKGAPEPVWMSKGIPATQKGKTMGLELEKK